MIVTTGRFNIYFKIFFTNKYLGKDKDKNMFCILYKEFDKYWGKNRWKVYTYL